MQILQKIKGFFSSNKNKKVRSSDEWVVVDSPENIVEDIGWTPDELPDYSGYYDLIPEESLVPQGQSEPYLRPAGPRAQGLTEIPFPGEQVFTDGSCGENKSGYGIFMKKGHSINRAVRLDVPHDSNRAEIQAILQSLLLFQNFPEKAFRIRLLTDSLVTILALHHIRGERERWIPPNTPNWARNVLPRVIEKYREELNVVITLAERFPQGVVVEYVKSHSGHYGNEWADLLAKISTMGIQKALRSKKWDDVSRADRPYSRNARFFQVKPSDARRNISLLMLDVSDRTNRILYPNQQMVWDQRHGTTEGDLEDMLNDFH